MDEFGDITVDDLLDLKESFEDEIETLMEYIRETHRKHTLTSGVRGQVLKQAKSNSSEEQKYGVGAVMVRIPRLDLEEYNEFWARPKRFHGRLDVPPVDTWVHIQCLEGSPEYAFYSFTEFLDGPARWGEEEDSGEEIGFQPVALTPLYPGALPDTNIGGHLSDVRDNPDKVRLFESDKDFAFLKDSLNSLLRLMTSAGYEIQITTGAAGKIFIGGYDPSVTTSPGLPAAGVEIEIEGNGGIKLYSLGGNIEVESSGGEVTVKGTTKVTVESTVQVVVDAPLVKLGGSSATAGVVTNLTDPLVDNITGAPHIGSTTVLAL